MRLAYAGHDRQGFTIIELMVALVVTAMVLGVAHVSLQVATDATARIRVERQAALGGPASRATLDGWLRAATLVDHTEGFFGVHRTRPDAPPADELSFAVLDAGPFHPGPHRIRLWIAQEADTARRGLLAEVAPLRRATLAAADTLQVSPQATGLAIRYRVRVGARDQWVNDWRSDRQLPSAIDLRAIGPRLDPLLAIPLRLPLGGESL